MHRLRPLQAGDPDRVWRGQASARIVLVGEQPGNEEDLSGRPFVGPPAGFSTRPWPRRTWTAAKCTSRTSSSTSSGKAEREASGGFTSGHGRTRSRRAVRGSTRSWDRQARGAGVSGGHRRECGDGTRRHHPVCAWACPRLFVRPAYFVTVHPSAILRMPDRTVRQAEMRRFVADLRRARRALPER